MKFTNILILSSALVCGSVQGQILISTDFSGSTGNRALPYTDANDASNNGNRAVTRNAFAWTVTDATKVDLGTINNLSFGAYTWGSAGTPIQKGNMFTTLAGGQFNSGSGGGGNVSTMRQGGNTFQYNAGIIGTSGTPAPADIATYNLVFEVVSGSYNNLSASFTLGTAATNGVFNANDAAQNGNFNVRISPIVSGVVDFANGFYFYGSPQSVGAGAGPMVNATANVGDTIVTGLYLLQIEHFGKTSGQRSSIGEFSLGAIPEPSTYALLFGVATLGVVLLRRRRA